MKQNKRKNKVSGLKKWWFLFSALLIFTMAAGTAQAKEKMQAEPEKDKLEVHYIDVGQGDATLIKCGDSAMLIDAGDSNKGTLIQNYLKKQNVTKLDYLILTHPHEDHIGGADVIITKYDIDQIIMPNYEMATASYRDLIQAMDDKQHKPVTPVVGTTYELGSASFMIVAPNKKNYGENCNNYSVGLILQHGTKRFLFTGDAEEEAEKDLLKNGISLNADVIKAGHHGSKTSTSDKLIKAVAPEYAVVSCQENNEYGMPHASVLNALRAANVKLFRTDEQGSLIATSDGKEIKWNAAPTTTWKAGEPTKSSEPAKSAGNTKKNTASKESSQSASKETPNSASKESEQSAASASKQSTVPVIEEKQQETAPVIEEPASEPQPQNGSGQNYVLNTKTKKFHYPTCSYLPTTNRSDSTQSRDDIVSQGYEACKKCNP